jgi:hypothetical protein
MGQTGLGSIDLYVGQGQTVPIVVTRIFNDAGANGTSGFAEPFVEPADVPNIGTGFLIGPSDTARFRYNIGVRTLGGPVNLMATVRDSAGNTLHSVTNVYPANSFIQTSSTDFLGFSLGNDESIEIAFAGGGLIAYGATVDNVTNDPSAQFMPYVSGSHIAQGTVPRRSPFGTGILLAVVLAMLGVGVSVVVVKR